MKVLKKILKIVVFFTIFIGGQALIKYAILDDTLTISRVMIHDLYTEETNIDILVCGASHCQLGFDTEILDEGFGRNTFNAGSSSQGLETTLALIKEAEKYHDLQQVYVDLDYSIVMRDTPNLESIYIVSDYMKPSLRKISYLLNATSFDYYVNSFMPLHKGRGYTKNPGKMVETIQKKSNPDYWNYRNTDASYAGKGHIASRTVVEEGTLWCKEDSVKKTFNIPKQQQEYLQEIIEFCSKKNIRLTFVSVPVTDFHLELMQNYDEYVLAVKEFLAGYDMPYYDFNLCNPDIMNLQSDSYYNDDNHLNMNGTKVFGKAFTDFFTGKIAEENLFCESYRKKRELCRPRVLGMMINRTENNGEIVIEAEPVVNTDGMEVLADVQKAGDVYYITATVDGVITNKIEVKDEELR